MHEKNVGGCYGIKCTSRKRKTMDKKNKSNVIDDVGNKFVMSIR